MKINARKISTNFNGNYCFTHARGAVLPSGDIFITTQPLLLSGVDAFFGMHKLLVDGKNFTSSPITPCENLTRKPFLEDFTMAICDCTPVFHKATNKLLLLGHNAIYGKQGKLCEIRPRHTVYAVYDEKKGDFSSFETLDLGTDTFFNAGNGSGQSYEEENGDLLIPFYFRSRRQVENNEWDISAAVMRCKFDGAHLQVLELGEPIRGNAKTRGYCEPSIVKHNGEYFLCLRNDESGFITKSKDGLRYDTPQPLLFDDGTKLENYCTQQHWLTGGGKLWLVYTRRDENNGHVFRHRAPLFIAEVNPKTLRVIRATEKIAVPNRGARLGNFGCSSIDASRGLVIAAEWMQFGGGKEDEWKRCAQYGSDNSIFISEIRFDEV